MPVDERIIFFGRNANYQITHLCFRALLRCVGKSAHKLVATVVSDDHRGELYTLEEMVRQAGLPCLSAPENDVNAPPFLSKIAELKPTLLIVVQFPKIFGAELIGIPERAALNLHRGWPLRGGSIDERSIYHSLPVYYVILHHITTGIDTGNIIGKVAVSLSENDDGYSLSRKSDEAGEKLFKEIFLPLIGSEIPRGEEQVVQKTVYAAKGSLSSTIDLKDSAENIARLCRAFHHPRKLGAMLPIRGKKIYLPYVKTILEKSAESPGTILTLKRDEVVLAVGDFKIMVDRCNGEARAPLKFSTVLSENGFKEGGNLLRSSS